MKYMNEDVFMMFRMKILYYVSVVFILSLAGCQPEMPVTSSIIIDTDAFSLPVNEELYGLTVEEINHAIDGGLYAELIQNRSFEDGVPPLNCPYDASRNVLITPNGWAIPFIRPDSIPGWRKLSASSGVWIDNKELINDKNRRSLLVSVSGESGRGGVAAEGYNGISVRKGEKYSLSFYIKGASMIPKTISIALSDSAGKASISDVFQVSPAYEWKKYQHTFTASENTDCAMLTFTTDSSAATFWLDVVSLFPEKTWNNRKNGLRPDLMKMIAALNPRFIRFPGGSFVEGYTAGTYPIWKETIGDISERRHFWNIWSYGTTNGMGFHEYLQMCEDLKSDPIYVINSGVTSQSRRPRYEDITAMDKLVQDALDAIAYANEPTDSIIGAMRGRNGHPESFGLKFVEIGSENYGQEYSKRFQLFKKAINEIYPEITVIASSAQQSKTRSDWADSHIYSGETFLIVNHDRYEAPRYSRRSPSVFIGEFSLTDKLKGTMRAAISEACFLVGVENSQDIVRRLAYAPILGNVNFQNERYPAISFNNNEAVASPSYFLMKMFNNNRGDEVLKTKVETYSRPQVTFGRAGIELFDNSFEIKGAGVNNVLAAEASVLSGGWLVNNGVLVPEANRWNYILMGDSLAHDYTLSADIKRTKGSGQIQFRVRDNGLSGDENDYIGMTIGAGISEFYHQAGGVKDTLRTPINLPFESNKWYTIRVACKDESIRCYVNDSLIHEVVVRPLPSLVAVATLDKETNTILLKVVNTTMHAEKTALDVQGVSVSSTSDILELSGSPEARNTFIKPKAVIPVDKQITFSLGGPMVYSFPPNSITIMKLKVD